MEGVLIAGAYFACSAAFTTHSHGGLLTPDSSPDLAALALGAATLSLRVTLLFVAVPMLGAWVTRRVLA